MASFKPYTLVVWALVARGVFRKPAKTSNGSETPVSSVAETATNQPDIKAGGGKQPVVRLRYIVFGVLTLSVLLALAAFTGWQGGLASQRSPVVLVAPSQTEGGVMGDVYNVAAPATVSIRTPSGSAGSGFFISPDTVVTAAHVITADPTLAREVAGGKKPEVTLHTVSGDIITGTVSGVNSSLDVAVIRAQAPAGVSPLTWASGLPASGAPAAALGAPYGAELLITSGIVSGTLTSSQFASGTGERILIGTTAPVNPGMSGGPLLDDQGHVLGVVAMRPDNAAGRPVTGLTLAVPAPLLISTITALSRSEQPETQTVGITPEQVPGGVKVVAVTDGAQAAGIREGQTVVAVNGAPTPTVPDLIVAIAQAKGPSVSLTLEGQQEAVTVQLTKKPAEK